MSAGLHAAWHDLECGRYTADLPLWRELAAAGKGPVLDVGAGTGRVALDLARAGHEVVAVDRDAALLAVLRERAAGLPVETVATDARALGLGARRFGLVLAPMQTVQLLEGRRGRAAFLAGAARHLAPGGLLAAALADPLQPFDAALDGEPEPDVARLGDRTLVSRAVAIRDEGDRVALVRVREAGEERTEDVVRLDRLTPAQLEEEAGAHGLRAERLRRIPATDDHVGSLVVLLRA